jgi:hypothetical protein
MPGPEFMSFDSIEDAYEFMRKGEDFGNRNLHPKQAAITWGDYWVRFYDVANRLIIFGCVETEAEVEEAESRGIDQIVDPGEREMERQGVIETMRTIRDSHQRGLMWGWAYSKIDHDLGSTHRFHMWPITKELYEAVREVQWDVDALTDPAHRGELEQAWQEYRLHELSVIASGDHP